MNKLQLVPNERLAKLLNLEREIRKAEEEKQLEEIEHDIIKGYKMIEGDYKVIVTLYEASELDPRPDSFGIIDFKKEHCNSFVEIECHGKFKQSKVRKQTNNPIFDQRFYFNFPNMTAQQLQSASITFTVYDRSALIIKKSVIGVAQLDWTNIYFRRNHEIYRGWLALSPVQRIKDAQDAPTGYLLVNVAVLGPHDQQMVHDTKFIKDPLTTIEDTITIKKIRLLDYAIKVEVFRAENLIPIDTIGGEVKAYVVAKFSGHKIRTSKIRSTNPQWNELLKVGAKIPTKSKFLHLEVWASQVVFDDLIGVIRIPFTDISEGKVKQPRWGNLYGPPVSGKDKEPFNQATKMQLYGQTLGSHYRGRILFNIEGLPEVMTQTVRQKIVFKFPYRPIPNTPHKSYILRAYIFQGFELPGKDGTQICVHIVIGPYLLYSTKAKVNKGRCGWYEKLEDKKVLLPCSAEGSTDVMPDIMVYISFGDYENQRVSYTRIKANSVLTTNQILEANTYELNQDKSLNLLQEHECGGYLTMKVQLFVSSPPPSLNPKLYEAKNQKYQLRIYLYCAQGLPPMNQLGDCDPYIVFRCSGETRKSQVRESTLNPSWYDMYTLNVSFENILKSLSSKGIMCLVYDRNKGENDNFVGRFWVPIHSKNKIKFSSIRYKQVQLLHQKPKWFHIKNEALYVGANNLGKVLVGWSLIHELDVDKIDPIPEPKFYLQPRFKEIKLQLYVIGVRSLESDGEKWQAVRAVFSFSDSGRGTVTDAYKVKNAGCSLNSLISLDIKVPAIPELQSFMQVKLISQNVKGQQKFIGYTSIPVSQLLPKAKRTKIDRLTGKDIFDDQANLKTYKEQSSEDTLLDVQKLQKEIEMLKLKKRQEQLIRQKEVKLFDKKAFNTLVVPSEFNSTIHSARSHEIQNEMQRLLKDFDSALETDEQFDYIRKIQNEKDHQQLARRQKSLLSASQDVSIEHEQQRLLEVNFQELQKMPPAIKGSPTNKGKLKMQKFIEPSRTSIKKQESLQETMHKILKAKEAMQSQKSVQMDVQDLEQRFCFNMKQLVQPDGNINESNSVAEKAVKFENIEREMGLEHEHEKLALEKQNKYKFSSAVKLTLFKWRQRNRMRTEDETYQDFDTDPDQDLQITPEWYKGRKIIKTDYEDLKKPTKKMRDIDIYCGKIGRQGQELRIKQKIGTLKLISLSADNYLQALEKSKYYSNILSPKFYICRLYILKGKSLVSENSEKPSTYLKISFGNDVTVLKDQTLRSGDSNPEYYISHDIIMELPGPSTVKVEVMQHYKIRKDRVLGYTQIDVESRYLTRNWHLLQRKPIELRNLYSDYGCGSQGRLEVWIDLIERNNWETIPAEKIHAPPYDQYQLRVIVWTTKGCVFKDVQEECNDLFVRGFIGNSEPQETDVHWRCRGQGSFNWRWKFNVHYPPKPEDMYSDILTVQIWDKDVFGYNDLIGETRINLNKIHRLIEKTVKRRKPTKAFLKIIEKGMDITEKFYFDVYNEKQLDEFGNKVSQGRVQLSFELVPIEMAKEKYQNGYGRAQPNMYPSLPKPEGRMKFDFMHPSAFLRKVLGTKLYKKIKRKACTCTILFFLALVLVIFAFQIIANLIRPCK